MQGALALFGVAVLLWGLHRFLTYAEGRGWIYYRKKRGSYGGLGVTSNFLNMYDPSRTHLQQVVREVEWKRDEDDDGDQPPRDALRLASQSSRDALRLASEPRRIDSSKTSPRDPAW